MSKKDMASLLDRPHYQAASSGDNGRSLPPDPLIKTRIKVTLDNLVPFHDNPRQSRNPNYDEIKESIRNAGLLNAPNVTRKSPDLPYMIRDGGNTRLEILNELWAETGKQTFFEFDCDFYPYQDDLTMLLQHCIENEMRGGMILIERGVAAAKAKFQLEQMEGESLSNTVLARRLKALGWTINDKSLGAALYAKEVLLPLIPVALWEGLGVDSISRIRKMLEDCRTFWCAYPNHGLEADDEFETLWQSIFSELDSDYFDVSYARDKLEAAIAERIDCPLMSVKGEIQMISEGLSEGGVKLESVLTGSMDVSPAPSVTTLLPRQSPNIGDVVGTAIPVNPPSVKMPPGDYGHISEREAVPMSAKTTGAEGSLRAVSNPEVGYDAVPPSFPSSNPVEGAGFNSIAFLETPEHHPRNRYALVATEELQARTLVLARALAKVSYFEDLIVDPNSIGYSKYHLGFLVGKPSTATHEELFATANGKPAGFYQHLFFLSALHCNYNRSALDEWLDPAWLRDWFCPVTIVDRQLSYLTDRLSKLARPYSIHGNELEANADYESVCTNILNELEPLVGELAYRS